MQTSSPVAVESLSVLVYRQQPVVTTELLAQVYGTQPKNIHDNYLNNAERFIDGKHFIKLEGEALREFKNRPETIGSVGKNARALTLWTERGAARHAKMLDTDQAWEVFEKLEDCYFSVKSANDEVVPAPATITEEQKAVLLKMCSERHRGRPDLQHQAWRDFERHFGVEFLRLLPAARFFEACHFILQTKVPIPRPKKPLLPVAAATLPAPVVRNADPGKEARFDRRAMELAMRAYDTYSAEIRADHLIARGMRTIEEWLPPRLAENLLSDAKMLIEFSETYARSMRKTAADISRMSGVSA